MTSPSFRAYFAQAITVSTTFDAHTAVFLTLCLRSTLSVIQANFGTDSFVVALESGIVVAQSAVWTVSVLSAFLFFAFSCDAFANSVFASFREVSFTSLVTDTFVRNAFVFNAKLVFEAVFFANTIDGCAHILVASRWAS